MKGSWHEPPPEFPCARHFGDGGCDARPDPNRNNGNRAGDGATTAASIPDLTGSWNHPSFPCEPMPFIYKQFLVMLIQKPDEVLFYYNGNGDIGHVT